MENHLQVILDVEFLLIPWLFWCKTSAFASSTIVLMCFSNFQNLPQTKTPEKETNTSMFGVFYMIHLLYKNASSKPHPFFIPSHVSHLEEGFSSNVLGPQWPKLNKLTSHRLGMAGTFKIDFKQKIWKVGKGSELAVLAPPFSVFETLPFSLVKFCFLSQVHDRCCLWWQHNLWEEDLARWSMIGMICNVIQIWKLTQIYDRNLVNHRLLLLQLSSSHWEGPRHATQSTSISEPGLIKPSLGSLATCHEAFCWSKKSSDFWWSEKSFFSPFSTHLKLFQEWKLFDSQMFDLLEAIYTKSPPNLVQFTQKKQGMYTLTPKNEKKQLHFVTPAAYKNQKWRSWIRRDSPNPHHPVPHTPSAGKERDHPVFPPVCQINNDGFGVGNFLNYDLMVIVFVILIQ